GVDTELAFGETGERIEHGVQEHGDGSKHDHGGYGHANLVRFAFDYALGGQHGRGSTDAAARAHQQGGIGIEAEYARAQPVSDQQNAADDSQIEYQRARAEVRKIGDGEPDT